MNQPRSSDHFAQQRFSNQVSSLVLVAMLVCLAVTYTQALRWLTRGMPELRWEHLPLLAFLTAIEAIFTRPVVRDLEGRARLVYHLAEWVTFAVVLKGVSYALNGFETLAFDLVRWQQDFLTFFDAEFVFAFGLVLLIWLLGRASANDLHDLTIDPADLYWELGKLQNSRAAIRARLVSRILWSGIALVILASGIRANITATAGPAVSQEPVLNILIYFFLALILLSQTQYRLLNGRWFWHQTAASPQVARRWLRYGAFFFALLAALSFILPTNYALGLLETLNAVVSWGVTALLFLLQLLFLPILWLLSISGCTAQTAQPPSEAPPPLALFTPPPPSQPIPWLELLQSIFFWSIFLGIIGFALIQFIRQNTYLTRWLARFPLTAWVEPLWQWLSGWLRGTSKQLVTAVRDLAQRLTLPRNSAGQPPARAWLNFKQLNPRQQILFYYLQLLDRAQAHGIKRSQAETPNQYADTLRSQIPEVEEDITELTAAFVKARYSAHPISTTDTAQVQSLWRKIARAFKRFRHPKPPSR